MLLRLHLIFLLEETLGPSEISSARVPCVSVSVYILLPSVVAKHFVGSSYRQFRVVMSTWLLVIVHNVRVLKPNPSWQLQESVRSGYVADNNESPFCVGFRIARTNEAHLFQQIATLPN